MQIRNFDFVAEAELQASHALFETVQFTVGRQAVVINGRRLKGPNFKVATLGGVQCEGTDVSADIPKHRPRLHKINPL